MTSSALQIAAGQRVAALSDHQSLQTSALLTDCTAIMNPATSPSGDDRLALMAWLPESSR